MTTYVMILGNLGSIDNDNDKEPSKHTVIFLKEMARCSKTFKKKFIGIWYERYVKSFNDDVAVQGLAGRATGYDDNGLSIIYTNVESIKRYIDLWENDFSNEVAWCSNTTRCPEKTGNGVYENFKSALKTDGVKEDNDVDPELSL